MWPNGDKTPYLGGLLRGRLAYAPGDDAKLTATVVNPTREAFKGRLTLHECFGLDGVREAAEADVSLSQGEARGFDLEWTPRKPEGGRFLSIALLDKDGKELDRGAVPMGVAKDARGLHYQALDFASSYRGSGSYYVAPTSTSQIEAYVDGRRRDRNNLGGRCEIFSWSWCDVACFVPPEDPYIGNEGQYWLSLKNRKEQISLMRGAGYHLDSYINGCAWNEAALDIYRKHPDWFMYDANGEHLGHYNMEALANRSRSREFGFKIAPHNLFFEVTFDPTRKEVREWIGRQCVSLGKEMGFQGGRWDVWFMNVEPGCRRLDGSVIAADRAEADRLSAESLKAVKDIVADELSDFTWGYNYAAPEENKDTPLLLAEKCRGGGWMLDEVAINYGAKTSPFHFWKAYDKRMVEWGDRIRQLGGIYDPWTFDRGYMDVSKGYSDTDWIYSSIFRLLAGGRCWNPLYKNESALVGDLALLGFRFNDIYSGWNLRLQPEDQRQIAVEAPETLWWKGHVLSSKSADGRAQRVVHLVNSPMAEEARENPDSKLRPPVLNVKVRCAALDGRLPGKAWLLMAEPIEPGKEPEVRAAPLSLEKQGGDAVSVAVPAVIALKTVVFEF